MLLLFICLAFIYRSHLPIDYKHTKNECLLYRCYIDMRFKEANFSWSYFIYNHNWSCPSSDGLLQSPDLSVCRWIHDTWLPATMYCYAKLDMLDHQEENPLSSMITQTPCIIICCSQNMDGRVWKKASVYSWHRIDCNKLIRLDMLKHKTFSFKTCCHLGSHKGHVSASVSIRLCVICAIVCMCETIKYKAITCDWLVDLNACVVIQICCNRYERLHICHLCNNALQNWNLIDILAPAMFNLDQDLEISNHALWKNEGIITSQCHVQSTVISKEKLRYILTYAMAQLLSRIAFAYRVNWTNKMKESLQDD